MKHRTVQLCNNITFQLIPHLHEFDSEAIVTKYVTYEQEVFAYLESNISEYDSVIEIGGNVGIFSLFFYETFLKYHKIEKPFNQYRKRFATQEKAIIENNKFI
ncbi:hypothetical protein [Dolichospermum circinale]|uniref:hypothetical protein n=1 Tax=Dolichospermum circinale TaxID=109265 RepID=UPI0012DE76B8|nr:hypothetical protein [Dolichospermum circinale]MDB9476274.1 hypothetical protein [Dolichospermum circinale CS-537/11]MDB9484530.1 hypothetical protein [Dolichospermum circinale CS-537/05]